MGHCLSDRPRLDYPRALEYGMGQRKAWIPERGALESRFQGGNPQGRWLCAKRAVEPNLGLCAGGTSALVGVLHPAAVQFAVGLPPGVHARCRRLPLRLWKSLGTHLI